MDDLVVLGTVDLAVDAGVEGNHLGWFPLGADGEVEVTLVHAALLENVLGARKTVVPVHAVDIVQAVPVDMHELRVAGVAPCFRSPCPLGEVVPVVVRILHPEVARQVAVIVRTRVLGIVPVKGGVAVLSEAVEDGRACAEVVLRSKVVFDDCYRLVGDADAGVAHLSVLIAPVGVVHVVAHEVIYLLGGSVLRTSLARSGHEDEAELMDIVEFLLCRSVVAE